MQSPKYSQIQMKAINQTFWLHWLQDITTKENKSHTMGHQLISNPYLVISERVKCQDIRWKLNTIPQNCFHFVPDEGRTFLFPEGDAKFQPIIGSTLAPPKNKSHPKIFLYNVFWNEHNSGPRPYNGYNRNLTVGQALNFNSS